MQDTAGKYHHLKNIKSKIQRKATDIGFIRKALSHEVIPTFAKVKGQFNNNNRDRWKAERSIMESQLKEHYRQINRLLELL